MPLTYSINDLERLTGIKAHTIRIWEKRYGLLSPERTTTNIRNYNDDALRKLLNVNTLLKEGWKISRISKLNVQELESQVWNCAKTSKSTEHVYEIYMQAMISATLSFDEEWFENVFQDATSRFGLSLCIQNIIGPFLNRIGLMWSVLKIHPGQEHFASCLVRQKMIAAIDKLPQTAAKGMYLLFLPPWEEHEIGLLYAMYLLRSSGYQVLYLGQRVPLEALKQTLDATNPDMLLTFFVTEEKPETIREFVETVRGKFTKKPFYCGARQELLPELDASLPITILDSPTALLDLL